jgi:hypothetical protein
LQGQPKGYLEARHGVFVADIQRMPRLIAKMFAVPAMRPTTTGSCWTVTHALLALSRACG